MQLIGILTQDFRIYYDLIVVLRAKNIPFMSLTRESKIPSGVKVILTSKEEAKDIDFHNIVEVENDIEIAVNKANRMLLGKEEYARLIIGIDPGERPGVAVVGDGKIITTDQMSSPEGVLGHLQVILESFPAKEVVVRIGHGDPTHRNRIINSLSELGVSVEIADESRTTEEGSDIQAAINIAFTRGYKAKDRYEIEPTDGELKDIQRRSRMLSQGRVTISKVLATKVARGELTLEEAVEAHEKVEK